MGSKLPVRHRTGRSLGNIAAASGSVAESAGTSLRHRSQHLGIPRSTMQRIVTEDLHLHAYKIQLTQELKPTDQARRREFVNWVLENQEVDGNFSKKIIFSDEAHFQLDGYANTQNCRIWGAENPRVIHEKPMHAKRATFWCGFWAGGVTGPYFFENEAGNADSEWRTLSQHDNGVFVASIGRCGYGRHVVPAGRRNLSHCARNNGVVARKIFWPSSHAMAIIIGHRGRAI